MKLSRWVVILITQGVIWTSTDSFPADRLPYSTRTRPYSGWSTAAQGDIRTVGMAGATVGLANTFISALDNPAGLAMTLNGADSNFVANTIYDGNVQSLSKSMNAYNFGLAFSDYPWGFAFGYSSRTHEGQEYNLQNSPTTLINPQISTGTIYLSGARLFMNNKLSVGLNLLVGQSQEQIEVPPLGTIYQSFSISGSMGASWQLPNRVILGMSYSLPTRYNITAATNAANGLPGFFQPVDVPGRFGAGVGWIPNRFFQLGFGAFLVGTTPDSALLKDNSVLVGQSVTIQPKVGASYRLLDLKELRIITYLGSYLEISRIQNAPDRVHLTSGVEFFPWILMVGGALDTSTNYSNYIIGFGIDVLKTMEKLDIVPKLWHPPYGGFAPNLSRPSDDGLARPLVQDWRQRGPVLDPVQIGINIPKKIEEKANALGATIKKEAGKLGDHVSNIIEGGVQALTPKKPAKNPPKHLKRPKAETIENLRSR